MITLTHTLSDRIITIDDVDHEMNITVELIGNIVSGSEYGLVGNKAVLEDVNITEIQEYIDGQFVTLPIDLISPEAIDAIIDNIEGECYDVIITAYRARQQDAEEYRREDR